MNPCVNIDAFYLSNAALNIVHDLITYATRDITKRMYWSVIETNIGILAASIPSFKPVARRYLPFLVGEYSGDRSCGRGFSGHFDKYMMEEAA